MDTLDIQQAIFNAANNPAEPIYDGDEEILVYGSKIEQYNPYKYWYEQSEDKRRILGKQVRKRVE